MKAKIIWVHDDFDGPYNGVASIVDEPDKKFWFKRVGDDFEFLVLSEEQDKFLFSCHEQFCQETGKPILHGDPYIIKFRELTRKMDFKKEFESLSESEKPTGFEGTTRGLDTFVKAQHSFNSEEISGEVFAVLKKEDILNYNIPRNTIFM